MLSTDMIGMSLPVPRNKTGKSWQRHSKCFSSRIYIWIIIVTFKIHWRAEIGESLDYHENKFGFISKHEQKLISFFFLCRESKQIETVSLKPYSIERDRQTSTRIMLYFNKEPWASWSCLYFHPLHIHLFALSFVF